MCRVPLSQNPNATDTTADPTPSYREVTDLGATKAEAVAHEATKAQAVFMIEMVVVERRRFGWCGDSGMRVCGQERGSASIKKREFQNTQTQRGDREISTHFNFEEAHLLLQRSRHSSALIEITSTSHYQR